jgi:hypothetical protein
MNERDTFQADQAEAESRDQQAWETNLASSQMDVAMKAAHGTKTQAATNVLNALASLVNVAWVLVLLGGLAFIAHLIKGWF